VENVFLTHCWGLGILILRDPGADSWGDRQIKWAKLVQAEAWCEQKFTGTGGNSPREDTRLQLTLILPVLSAYHSDYLPLGLQGWGILVGHLTSRQAFLLVASIITDLPVYPP